MARQASMGDAHRDANLGRMKANEQFSLDDIRLAEEMGLVNQQALAREDSLFNDRLLQGFDQIQQLNDFGLRENSMLLGADLQQRGQNIGHSQFLQDQDFRQGQADQGQANWMQEFERLLGRDKASDSQWDKSFNYQQERDKTGDSRWGQEFGYQQQRDVIADQMAQERMNWEKQQFASETEWRRHTYNNMSASERASFDLNKQSSGNQWHGTWKKPVCEISYPAIKCTWTHIRKVQGGDKGHLDLIKQALSLSWGGRRWGNRLSY